MIGDDARIGSNAVVLKDVPDSATAVGVPAQIVRCRKKTEKCFEAYAAEKTDPMMKALEELKAQVKTLEKQIAAAGAGKKKRDQRNVLTVRPKHGKNLIN